MLVFCCVFVVFDCLCDVVCLFVLLFVVLVVVFTLVGSMSAVPALVGAGNGGQDPGPGRISWFASPNLNSSRLDSGSPGQVGEMGGAPGNPVPRNHFWCGLSNHQAATAQMGT